MDIRKETEFEKVNDSTLTLMTYDRPLVTIFLKYSIKSKVEKSVSIEMTVFRKKLHFINPTRIDNMNASLNAN